MLEDKYLELRYCAEVLGVHIQTMRNAVKKGHLKAFKAGSVGSSRYKIKESDFRDYLEKRTGVKQVPKPASIENITIETNTTL